MANKRQFCTMCGKQESETEILLKGKHGCICDECVDAAYDMLLDMREDMQQEADIQLMTPSQIWISM